MNPQRIVAGLAAIAIGFGVTLVGVALADDDGETIATVESVEPRSSTVENGSATEDEAEQDEATAEPPPAAEVIDEGDVPIATSNGDTTPRDGGVDPAVDDPTSDVGCEQVLVVRTGSGQLLILSSELGEFSESGDRFFLPGSNESIGDQFQAREIALISGIIDDRFGSRSVEDCATGQLLDATITLDLDGIEPDGGEAIPGDVGAEPGDRRANALFPCSDEVFDVFLDELDGLEATELITDADVFVRVLAKRLARFGGTSVTQWEIDIEQRFDGFVDIEDCVDEIDRGFVDDEGNGFFCASANVSTDARLFEFFDEVVPDRMTECSSVQEEGVN